MMGQVDLSTKETRPMGYYRGRIKKLSFEGFLKYTNQTTDVSNRTLSRIEECNLIETTLLETETKPPQYLNESSIVKKLESSGVGRPSTYASIVSTLYTRNYTLTKDV